jgi:Ca2+-binding EF-hand superfamily protein
MKKLITLRLVSLTLSLAPAFAQIKDPSSTPKAAKSAAECQENWKAADKNKDGRLEKSEIDAATQMIPASLSTNATISQQEFLSACSATITGGAQK